MYRVIYHSNKKRIVWVFCASKMFKRIFFVPTIEIQGGVVDARGKPNVLSIDFYFFLWDVGVRRFSRDAYHENMLDDMKPVIYR